jgi:Mrp family chromosome partitioning ATPase
MAILGGIINLTSSLTQSLTQNKTANAEVDAANKAALADTNILKTQEQQIETQSNLETQERQRQALRERARMMVAMGESGVSGSSPLRELYNSKLQENYDIGIIDANEANRLSQNQAQIQAVEAQRLSRINEANAQKSNPYLSSLFGGIQGISEGLDLAKSWFGK